MKQQQSDLLNELNQKELLLESKIQKLEQATVIFTILQTVKSELKYFYLLEWK